MNTGPYTCLEIFARATGGDGRVIIRTKEQGSMEQAAGRTYHAWLRFQLEPDAQFEIVCASCEVSLAYLSGSADMMETGVCYLERDPVSGSFIQPDPQAWYDHAARESYHFTPWKNWINDPNGLCWYQGYYHMFYQCNPHRQEWSNMYWGHAASRDLIHWAHLPIVLAPQEEILERPGEIKGGAFSGSAVALEDKVVFYLTRHSGPLEDCEDTVEQQWMLHSRDMIHFSQEECVIDRPPAGASFDFRDPKVLKIGAYWYMVLGSAIKGRAAILLYRSQDMEHWEYQHPLLVEETPGIRCFECPDLMELDGKYLAIGAWMAHRDDCGRYQMCRYYVGSWQEEAFVPEKSGWFDFGSNCYAMQSFAHAGRRISFGWIADLYDEHVRYENGAHGSMTLPREMHIREGRLYMMPVSEVGTLKGAVLYQGGREDLDVRDIAGNAYRAAIRFREETSFTILLAEDGDKRILLVNDKDGLRIRTEGVKTEGIVFRADVDRVLALEIYMDRRVAEVYVNDGEAVGTKLFYNSSDRGCFVLHADKPEHVENVELALMERA